MTNPQTAKEWFLTAAKDEAAGMIDGAVINNVLSPGVHVEAGAVVRDSVIMNDTVVRAGALVDHCVLDKEIEVGREQRLAGAMTAHPIRLNQPTSAPALPSSVSAQEFPPAPALGVTAVLIPIQRRRITTSSKCRAALLSAGANNKQTAAVRKARQTGRWRTPCPGLPFTVLAVSAGR